MGLLITWVEELAHARQSAQKENEPRARHCPNRERCGNSFLKKNKTPELCWIDHCFRIE